MITRKISDHWFDLVKILFVIAILISVFRCSPKASKVLIPVDESRDIPITTRLLEVDQLGNIYVVDQGNRLVKYDKAGMFLFDYYSRRLGPISMIDVTNPLETLIFFERFGEVKILDSTLSEIRRIQLLDDQRFLGSEVVAKSNDNNIWVVDPTGQQIVKVNDRLEVIVETNRFGDLGLSDVEVLKMIESGNKLIVLTDKDGFLIFDNFGQFDKKIQARGATDFQFDGVGLTYETMTGFRYRKVKFPDNIMINLPQGIQKTDIIKARKHESLWIIGYQGGVDIVK